MTSGLLVTRQLQSYPYEYFATSFLIVLVLRIVKGSVSTFANGTVKNSDVPGLLRRHQ
jgi:hypothetical protein